MGYTPLVIFICVAFVFMFVNMHWLVVFPLWRDERRLLSLAVALLYSALWFMSTFTYKLCIEVAAGTPPADYVPPDADEATLRAERTKQMAETLSPIEPEFERLSERRFGAVRFCRPCGAFKPPRAHHCKQCRRCVLLYDHHCPFIGQCLGYYNRKVFQLFLLYTVLGAGLSLALYLWRLIAAAVDLQHSRRSSDPFDTHGSLYLVSALVLIVIQLFVVLVVVFSVGSLMVHQINMLLNNTTTVEYHQYRSERYEAGRSFRWRHDLGSGLQNLKACMGQSVPGMFWPSVPTGNGFSASDRDAALTLELAHQRVDHRRLCHDVQ
jgi:ribosomal protein L40E